MAENFKHLNDILLIIQKGSEVDGFIEGRLGPFGMIERIPPHDILRGWIIECGPGSTFYYIKEHFLMKGLTDYQKFIYEELKAIVGDPQFTTDLNFWGEDVKTWKWTINKIESKDRMPLLVLRDKAQDLGLKAILMNDDLDFVGARRQKKKPEIGVENELANAVVVWVPANKPAN